MSKKYLMLFGFFAVLFLAACTNSGTTGTSVTPSTQLVAAAPSGEVVEVQLTSFRFGFEPSIITVKQGSTVRIIGESIDVPHGLGIKGYNLDLYMDGLRPSTLEFVADKKGEFPLYCSVPCGSGHSAMRGTLIVE